jgi:hypothetical protein
MMNGMVRMPPTASTLEDDGCGGIGAKEVARGDERKNTVADGWTG